MIIKQYIKDFENLGFGMFVHFGIYSVLGKGEWAKDIHNISNEDYAPLFEQFHPDKDWAVNLVKVAKKARCKYITLTTRHHDGFSLYDTCGLNDYDALHCCGRDLVREFVDACRAQEIIPFFYHTLLDWYVDSYKTDFKTYLKYLRDSVEIICTNYGKIGGIWFDGMWDKPNEDWEEDALYSMIRSHQPEAMIINNTGLHALGALGHIELDSVTFERGKPQPINLEGSPKYIASEMCEILADHWGYAREDLNYKAPAQMIQELAECRRYGANMLMNIGPRGDGSVRPMDEAAMEVMGQWIDYFEEAIRKPRPTQIEVEGNPNDFILREGNNYYLFCTDLPMVGSINVTLNGDAKYQEIFNFESRVKSINWMDNGQVVPYEHKEGKLIVYTEPFEYGRSLVVRVAKIVCE